MDIEVDLSSQEAVYEQIVRQIQQAVRSGALVPGAALPAIRQLADDLELNHNTVAKAYKILEMDRIIRTAGRKGTFIHPDAASHLDQRHAQDAHYLMSELVGGLAAKGLSVADISGAFAQALAKLQKGPQ